MALEEVGARVTLKDRRQFSGEADKVEKDLDGIGRAAKKANKEADNAGRGFLTLSRGFHGLRAGIGVGVGALATGTTAIAGLSVAAGLGGLKLLNMASDAHETASAFDTVFGPSVQQVGGFLDDINDKFGIPTDELEAAATRFGVFGKAAGVARKDLGTFTDDVVQAGLDLSSFYNRDPGDVFTALRSGLAGEAEPLRDFGIFLSDATMKAEAASIGLKGELSESQKVMVRHRIIMKSLGDAAGDLERTSGGMANQWRGFKGRMHDAGVAIGSQFLPYAEDLLQWANGKMQPAQQWLEDHLKLLPGIIHRGGAAIGGMVSVGRDLVGVIGHLGGGSSAWAAGVDEAAGANGALTPILQTGYDVVSDLWAILDQALIPAWQDVSSVVPDLLKPLGFTNDLLGFMADHASTLEPLVVGVVAGLTAWKLATAALNVVEIVSNNIKAISAARTMGLAAAHQMAAAGTTELTVGTGLLNTVMAMNPIVLVVAAIAALGVGLVVAYRHSETFRGAVQAVWEWLQKAWDTVLGFGGDIVHVFAGLDSAAKKTGQILLAALYGPVAGFSAAWNAIDIEIDISIPKWVPGLGGKGFHVNDLFPDFHLPGLQGLPGLAAGGVVSRGGLVMTGERGPEVGYWPAGSTVFPNAVTKALPSAALQMVHAGMFGLDEGLDDLPSIPVRDEPGKVLLDGREVGVAILGTAETKRNRR